METRAERIEAGMQMVRKTALSRAKNKPVHSSIDAGDLIGAGHEGLLKAIRRFEPSMGRFAPYAQQCIKFAMTDELRSYDRFTRPGRAKLNKYDYMIDKLTSQLGRTPTDTEMATGFEMSPVKFKKMQKELFQGLHLGIWEEFQEDLIGTDTDNPHGLFEKAERRYKVEGAVRGLPAPLRKAVLLHYFEGHTLAKTGDLLGVSESRVCQKLTEAREILKNRLETND